MPGIREDWFPTSIWYFDREEPASFDEALLAAIQAERARDPEGMTNRSSVLGWHSTNDLYERPEFQPFAELALRRAYELARFYRWDLAIATPFLKECWAIVNPRHGSNAVHSHPHSVLSGVYYVHAPPESGYLFFQDPRDALLMTAPPIEEHTPLTFERVTYEPVNGRMLIFPSWLAHGVEPNLSDQDRVCLSFNIGLHYR